MRTEQNDHCFKEPHWHVIARGFQTEAWFADGEAVGTGGIASPQRTKLDVGHYDYRFASSTSSYGARVGGGWWIVFDTYRTINAFAERNGYSLKEAARLMLALPHSWTRVDLLVRALLVQPLDAYTGFGKPAQGAADGPDRGTVFIPTQHIKVMQLYIPGLYVAGPRERQQLYTTAFQVAAEPTRLV